MRMLPDKSCAATEQRARIGLASLPASGSLPAALAVSTVRCGSSSDRWAVSTMRFPMRTSIFSLMLFAPLLASAAGPAEYKIFYCVYQANDCVETPKPMRAEEAARIFERVATGEKNFLGFVDSEGVILQLYVDAPDRIWVEIPAPERNGSFGTYMTKMEAAELVRGLSGPLAGQKSRLELKFKAW